MGTNTLVTKADGEIIASSDPNQYKTALTVDLVPRNSAGVPTNEGGDLGTSSLRWKNVRAENVIAENLISDTASITTVNSNSIQGNSAMAVNSSSTVTVSGTSVTLNPSTGGNLVAGSNFLSYTATGNGTVNIRSSGTGSANLQSTTGALTLTRNSRTGFYCNSTETGIRNTNATPVTGFRCNNAQSFIEAEGSTRVTVTAVTMTLNPSLWLLAQDVYDSTVATPAANVTVTSDGRMRRFSSSRRIKKNIKDLKENNVLNLRAVTFDSKNDESAKNIIGLIAEEVNEIDQRLVPKHPKTGECEGVNYTAIGVMLIPIVRDLKEQVEKLEAKIKKLEAK